MRLVLTVNHFQFPCLLVFDDCGASNCLSALGLVHLLGEVVLNPHLLDLILLRLKPVDVGLFVEQDGLEQITRAVVADGSGLADGVVIGLDGPKLRGVIVGQFGPGPPPRCATR